MPRRPFFVRLREMPARDALGFVAAWWLMAFAAVALRFVAFARLAPWLGTKALGEPSVEPSPRQIAQAWFVHRAVIRAAHRTPFRSDCLPRALAAAVLCRWLRLPAVAYLGVRLGASIGEDPMSAHAWVRCGDVPVTGGPGARRFGTVARFRCYTPK